MILSGKTYILFIDIDSTLIDDCGNIPERNINAIKKARDLGHKIFLNTGRSYANIPENIMNSGLFDGVVCGDGSLVEYHGVKYPGKLYDADTLKEAAEYIFSHKDCFAVFEGIERCYVPEDRVYNDRQTAVSSPEDLMQKLKDDKIQVIITSKNLEASFIKEMSDRITFFPFTNYYDMVSVGMTKANGMKQVLDFLKTEPCYSIAFGDSENDRPMLELAGTAVVMGNADEAMKSAADYISSSNNDGGVGEAIENLLLKQ